mgnify:CR=1 FL=1
MLFTDSKFTVEVADGFNPQAMLKSVVDDHSHLFGERVAFGGATFNFEAQQAKINIFPDYAEAIIFVRALGVNNGESQQTEIHHTFPCSAKFSRTNESVQACETNGWPLPAERFTLELGGC